MAQRKLMSIPCVGDLTAITGASPKKLSRPRVGGGFCLTMSSTTTASLYLVFASFLKPEKLMITCVWPGAVSETILLNENVTFASAPAPMTGAFVGTGSSTQIGCGLSPEVLDRLIAQPFV